MAGTASSTLFSRVVLGQGFISGSTVVSLAIPLLGVWMGVAPAGPREHCYLVTDGSLGGQDRPWAMAERDWNQTPELMQMSQPQLKSAYLVLEAQMGICATGPWVGGTTP